MVATSKRYLLMPQTYAQLDMSGALQTATSRFLQKPNELDYSMNADYRRQIGSAVRRDGYEQVGRTIQHGNEGYGAITYNYGSNFKIIAGINNSTNTAGTVQFLDVNDYWNPMITNAAPNTQFSFLNYLDRLYVAGYSKDLNTYMTLTSIDSTLTADTTTNVQFAPKAKFITDYQNSLIAIGADVNGKKYPDRFYRSSPAIGFITRVQGDFTGLIQELRVDTIRYLKPTMQVDIYKTGTDATVVTSLTIISTHRDSSGGEFITFAPQTLTVPDNAEIWPAGRKGKLSLLWNVDYPTTEDSDWERIPPGLEENPIITAHGKNNNRLLLFTRNTMWKFDGSNLVNISENVGCVAPRSVANVSGWTIWLHTTGIWGYNDASGQLRLLSRGIDDYIRAISQATIDKASAVVNGRVYKLGVGEIADLTVPTTSTSTSSTSTSSTSSSTSSTSTSSTSQSSTSSSTSTGTTISTSSTSSSISSTSVSSTSRSTSTSSTSTSMSTSSTTTTTLASSKKVVRIIYDFDSNTIWTEQHKREFRAQFMHTMNGYTKPYFQDETGRIFRDEVGNLDNADTIPMDIQWGRSNHGIPLQKTYNACIVVSEKARGALVKIQIDGGNWRTIGQITQDEQNFSFPAGLTGTNIDYRITHNDGGDPPSIDGLITYFTPVQTRVS